MYRAIVCTPFGELNCPNPVFRTREGCEEFWLQKMSDFGLAIEGFRVMKISKRSNETREDLARAAMNLRLKLNPDMAHDIDKIAALWALYMKTTPWKLDEAIGVMIDALYKRKHKIMAVG